MSGQLAFGHPPAELPVVFLDGLFIQQGDAPRLEPRIEGGFREGEHFLSELLFQDAPIFSQPVFSHLVARDLHSYDIPESLRVVGFQ